jgi:ParB family chromosome partitioning protein
MSLARNRKNKTDDNSKRVTHRDIKNVHKIKIDLITKENPYQPRLISKSLVEEAQEYRAMRKNYETYQINGNGAELYYEETFGPKFKETLKDKQFLSLVELADSIDETGELIQPITLLKFDNEYMVVAGHRRYYAHLVLNKQTIDAIVKNELSDNELYTIALSENVQREDLNVIEIALSIQNALNKGIFKNQAEVSRKTGLDKTKVTKYIKSLELPKDIVDDIKESNSIKDVDFLYQLNSLKDETIIYEIYGNVKSGYMTRKDAQKEIKNIKNIKKIDTKCNNLDDINKKRQELANNLNKTVDSIVDAKDILIERDISGIKNFIAKLDDKLDLSNNVTEEDIYKAFSVIKKAVDSEFKELVDQCLEEVIS